MGAAMAANIAKAGLDVRVWNRTREKAEPLADVATVADSAASAADGADILVTMLADGPAVASAFEAASPASGTLWLQMSTVGLDWTDRLAALAEKAGVVFVDAPVLGTGSRRSRPSCRSWRPARRRPARPRRRCSTPSPSARCGSARPARAAA